jgi:hypothetical protein
VGQSYLVEAIFVINLLEQVFLTFFLKNPQNLEISAMKSHVDKLSRKLPKI